MHAGDLLSKRAELTPEREALLELASGRRFTYAALNERANRTANWLRDCGLGAGDRVALLAHNSVVYVDLLYACGKIGAVFVPLNWRLATAEWHYILSTCRPHCLIYEAEFEERLPAVDGRIPTQLVSLSQYEAAVAQRPSTEPDRPATLSQYAPYCILYTSGTTGRPKGAVISHRQVLWNAINTVISWELSAADVSPIFTPMFHAGGLFVFLTPLFYAGGRVIIARQFEAEAALDVIEREGCTVVLGVPTLFQMWLQTAVLAQTDFSRLRWFISGGAPCPPALIDAWHRATGTTLRQGYGLTEVGPNCFCMSNEEAVSRPGSVGKPIFHSRLRLVDAAGHNVPPGATGELIISGPHVCAGYLDNAEATAAALRDGWFYTGDMARQDEDGYFYIVGRFKDMLISGGENVYAAEVEAVFLQHPAVADCALIGRPDEKWGEVGLMVTVLAPGQTATAAELQAFCRQRLAAYKAPKEVIFVERLPYSPYGKVMKSELRQAFLHEQ
jgi:fatty-acyl-CoA synthase